MKHGKPTTTVLRARINQIGMTPVQWKGFVAAVKALKVQTSHPNYDDFAIAHTMSRHQMQAHDRYTFLPWHREFLLHFEKALIEIDPSVSLPYWEWTTSRTIPTPLADAAEWGVNRVMAPTDSLPTSLAAEIAVVMSRSTYQSFHNSIFGPHGEVHTLIGGEMGDIERSPRDVLFWLHHAFLDKLWSDWSADSTHSGQSPPDGATPLTNVNARLLPTDIFTHTSRQVFSTTNLGYTYK